MKGFRRFCVVFLAALAGLLLYNALVWHLGNRALLTPEEGGVFRNDLARMGYLTGYTHPRRNLDDLPRRHLEMATYHGEPVAVVTIGDSFSQGSGNGPNRFYQDHLASTSEAGVLNVGHFPGSRDLMETAVILLNSGFLDQVHPRYLLLEIVERNCYKYSEPLDLARTASLDELRHGYGGNSVLAADADDLQSAPPRVGFINTGNFKWLLYRVLYLFAPDAFIAKTCKMKLDRPLFSGDRGDTLLFLRKDINNLKKFDQATAERFNDNLNRLAAALRARGIELVFMPAPDKYTLYRPYIVNNPYPPSRFFELLRPLPKSYRFIDSEAILSAEIARGEKDVYYIDDTHWSWKAPRAIFARERFR